MAEKYAVVAEDSLPTLKLLVSLVEKEGYEVFPFQDGIGAWRFLNAWGSKIDLVVSDYVMPEMDGLHLLKLLRQSKLHARTPFVMVTGIQEKELMLQSMNLGISAFVVKPFLAGTIQRVLAKIGQPENHRGRILAVDDDRTCLALTSKILSAEGYSVEESGGSAHALESILMAIPDFDLVVSDVHMPGGSGFDLLTAIRSAGVQTPFLLMSGDSQINTLKHADLNALRLKFLHKENLAHALPRYVNDFLERRAA